MIRLLIVEDEPIIAYDLADQLGAAGFDIIGIAASVQQGAMLSEACDLAVLDVNLGRGETSAPLAELLTGLGKPFVVLTAYTVDQLAPVFHDAPVLPKPVAMEPLVARLQALARPKD